MRKTILIAMVTTLTMTLTVGTALAAGPPAWKMGTSEYGKISGTNYPDHIRADSVASYCERKNPAAGI